MQYYDIIIIGGELSGLVAGALLAKTDYRVLVLDPEPVKSKYKCFDAPFRRVNFPLPSWDAMPAMKKVLFDLNLISEFHRRLQPFEPGYQIVLPEHRLDVSNNIDTFCNELEREFPGNRQAVVEFYERLDQLNGELDGLLEAPLHLPPENHKEKREFHRLASALPIVRDDDGGPDLLAPFPQGHPFRTLFEIPLRFAGYLDPDSGNPFRLFRLAGIMRKGLFNLPNNLDDILEVFRKQITNSRGDIKQKPARGLRIKWGKVTGVEIGDAGETYGCDFVLLNGLSPKLLKIIPSKVFGKKLEGMIEDLEPKYYRFSLNLSTPQEAIPEGMQENVFFVRDLERPLSEDNLLYVSIDPLWKDTDLRSIHVSCLVPREALSQNKADYLARLEKGLITALEELMPFLFTHTTQIDVPWSANSLEDPAHPWRKPADQMDPMYSQTSPLSMSAAALPIRSNLKNLFLTGRQIFPGLGLEGEFLAASNAVRLIHRVSKKKQFL